MTDNISSQRTLRDYFNTDFSKVQFDDPTTQAINASSAQTGKTFADTAQEALVYKWMSSRIGLREDVIRDNFTETARTYFGKTRTPQDVYALVSNNYDAWSALVRKEQMQQQTQAITDTQEAEKDRDERDSFLRTNPVSQTFAAAGNMIVDVGIGLERAIGMMSENMPQSSALGIGIGNQNQPKQPSWWTKRAQADQAALDFVNDYYFSNSSSLKREIVNMVGQTGALVGTSIIGGPEATIALLAGSSFNPTYNATLQKMGTDDSKATDDQKRGAGIVALGATALNAFVWGKVVPGAMPAISELPKQSVADAAKIALTKWDTAATLAGAGGALSEITSVLENAASGQKTVQLDDLKEATKNALITGLMGKAFDVYGAVSGQRAANNQREFEAKIAEFQQSIEDKKVNTNLGTQAPAYRVEEGIPLDVEHATAMAEGKSAEEIQAFADTKIDPKDNPEANKALVDAITNHDQPSVDAYSGVVARQEASIPLRSVESIDRDVGDAVKAVSGDKTNGMVLTESEQTAQAKDLSQAIFDSVNQANDEAKVIQLRENIIGRSQPTAEELRMLADELTKDVVTAAERRIISTLVAKEFGLARITPKQWKKLLSDARKSRANIIRTKIGKLHENAVVDRVIDLFDAHMNDVLKKSADKLARNREIQDELRFRELTKLANQKNRILARQALEIKEQKEKTADVKQELADQRNLAAYVDRTRVMVERFLKPKDAAKLRREMMLPRSAWKNAAGEQQERVGFKTKEEADAWLDDYMKRAVELGELSRREMYRIKIDNQIAKQQKAEGKAAVGGRLKMTPEAKAAWDEYTKEINRVYDPAAEAKADADAEAAGQPPIIRRPALANKEVSSDELAQIYNDLKSIRSTGRTEWQLQRDAINEQRKATDGLATDAVNQHIAQEKAGLVRRMVYGGLKFADRVKILGRDTLYDRTRFVQAIGQTDSMPERMWVDGVRRGAYAKAGIHDEAMQTMRESRRRNGLWGQNFDEYFNGADGKTVRLNGEKITLSEAMEMYAHSRLGEGKQWDSLVNSQFNKQDIAPLLDPVTGERDMTKLNALLESIPKENKAFVDDIINWLDTRGFELADKQFYDEHGVHLEKRDGYFPMKFLDHYNEFEETYRRSLGSPSFTKKAVGGSPIKEFDFAGKFASHIEQLATYAGMKPETSHIREFLFHSVDGGISDFQRAMNEWEEGAGDDLRKRLDDVERGHAKTDEEAINKITNWVRKQYATSVIGSNISPIIKSHATMCLAMRDVPIQYTAEGMLRTLTHPVEMYQFLQANTRSNVVKNRNVMIDQTIRGRNLVQRAQNAAQLVGYWPMRMFDRLATDLAWCSKYSEILHEGGGTEAAHAEAVRMADDLVERSFASFDFESLSTNQRSNNAMMKILFQFTNDANHAYNAFVRDCAGAKNEGELMKVFGNWAFLMAPIYTGILAAGTMAGTAQKRVEHYLGEQLFGWYPQDEINWMEKLDESLVLEGQVWPFRQFGFINELQGYWARRFTNMALPDANVYEGEMFDQPFNLGAYELLQRGQYLGVAGGLLGIPGGVQAGSMIDKELNQE